MTKPVITVRPDMDIKNCARLFDRFGLAGALYAPMETILGFVTYEEIVLNGLLTQALQEKSQPVVHSV